ncbi:MAG TPA: TonB-dependent receptor [Steroidobacteraceae bacterium]|nr:TonB-dependent receptor [Steroidobacteraceae bacterium]
MTRTAGVQLVCAGFLAAGLLVSAVASAEESAGGVGVLDEIVVTATKRVERLQDVPVAVTVITGEQIEARGYTNYADYLNSVPNVWMQDIGPGQTQLYIRGLVAQGGGGFPVASYFGEAVTSILTNNGGFANLRLVDIERVEVLRGPQGTLFGANSLAGVIRIVPNAPDLTKMQANVDVRGWATAHSGDISGHVDGMLNMPIVTDKFALRLVGYKDDIAGYINNVVPAAPDFDYSAALGAPPGTLVIPGNPAFTHKDINSLETWGARVSGLWTLTDKLKIDFSYAAQGVTLDSEPTVQPSVGLYEVSRSLDQFERGLNKEDERLSQLVVNYSFGGATFTSASSYIQVQRSQKRDIGFLAAASGLGNQPWGFHDSSDGEAFTQEFRLASNGDAALQWLVGAFYSSSQFNVSQFVPDYSCPTCLPTVLAGQDFAFTTLGATNAAKQRQKSIFAEASYDFSPAWTLGLGGRYLKDYIEAFSPALDGFLAGGPIDAAPPVGGDNSVFNPSAYVRYKPTASQTYYLQAARGFRSGTVNQPLSYDPNGPCADTAAELGIQPFSDPDKLWTYELGLKSTWADGRVGTNVAVFHQKWDGVQLGTSQPCAFNGVVNGGDASGNGAEVEFSMRLATMWSANLSASYVHNEFDSVTPNLGYAEGDRVPGAPEQNASAGLQYGFSAGSSWTGYVRGDWVYVGKVHYNFGQGATAIDLVQGGYGQGNLRLAFRREALSLELFCRNLMDKRAAEATGDPAQNNLIYLIRPREIGVELRYGFGGGG